jgi:hypothetical protein
MMRDRRKGEVSTEAAIFAALATLADELLVVKQAVAEVDHLLRDGRGEKEWYSTSELAQAMGVSAYTVAEHWCNRGRIACEKVPGTRRWRIPGREYRRLLLGGALRPVAK